MEETRFVLVTTQSKEEEEEDTDNKDVIVKLTDIRNNDYTITYSNHNGGTLKITREYIGLHPPSAWLGPRELRKLMHSAVIRKLKPYHLITNKNTAGRFGPKIHIFTGGVSSALYEEAVEQIKYHLSKMTSENT